MNLALAYELNYVLVPLALVLGTLLAFLRIPSWGFTPDVAAIRDLRKRLKHARMSKMLRRLGVQPSDYLGRLGPGLVAAQLDTCVACPHSFQCDQALSCKRSAAADLSFCPNRQAVLERVRVS